MDSFLMYVLFYQINKHEFKRGYLFYYPTIFNIEFKVSL